MKRVFKIIILMVFIGLSLFVGFFHEPWADEAQAWLIARDGSVDEIIFNIPKYEGSPVLWHLLLKLLITCKFPYRFYFLVPVFFSSIGIYIILFKLKINDIYKVLLPFSYFIAFEYCIKARNYCLLLPILSIIAMLYEDRKKHPYLYNFFVLLLAFVSLHGAIISGVLYMFEIFEILSCIGKEGNLKKVIKETICVSLISVFYVFIIITLFPSEDVFVNITLYSVLGLTLVSKILYYCITILEAFCLKAEYFKILGIPTLVLVLGMFFCILKSNNKKSLFLAIFISEVAFICIIRITEHHIGLIFLTFIFATYLVKDRIQTQYKKIFSVLFTIVLCTQLVWYLSSFVADINIDFSAGKKTAEYIKTLDYKNKKIYASGYYTVSILPYFNENIFDGPRGEKTYYIWSKNNEDWIMSSGTEYLYPDILADEPDIVILHDYYDKFEESYEKKFGKELYAYTKLIKMLKNNEKYKVTYLPGIIIFKGGKGNRDNEGFYVFERRE